MPSASIFTTKAENALFIFLRQFNCLRKIDTSTIKLMWESFLDLKKSNIGNCGERIPTIIFYHGTFFCFL